MTRPSDWLLYCPFYCNWINISSSICLQKSRMPIDRIGMHIKFWLSQFVTLKQGRDALNWWCRRDVSGNGNTSIQSGCPLSSFEVKLSVWDGWAFIYFPNRLLFIILQKMYNTLGTLLKFHGLIKLLVGIILQGEMVTLSEELLYLIPQFVIASVMILSKDNLKFTIWPPSNKRTWFRHTF